MTVIRVSVSLLLLGGVALHNWWVLTLVVGLNLVWTEIAGRTFSDLLRKQHQTEQAVLDLQQQVERLNSAGDVPFRR